ncbi:hypothetical protein C0J52_17260 [Blattella germanica]|nr:hypothetical protein C0J52_17260 [Blattella germanica]
MERWSGRVAVITGASAGIGAVVAEDLVKKGLKVVGLARRIERVEELATKLKSEKGKLYAKKCDVSKESEVKETFQWIKSNLGKGPSAHWKQILDLNVMGLSMCTSEALQIMKETGVDDGHIVHELATKLKSEKGKLYAKKCDVSKESEVKETFQWIKSNLGKGPSAHWKQILDLNVMGLSMCTSEALQIMKETGVDDGHIVHVNSVVGQCLPNLPFMIYMYAASKHAVTVLTEGLRRELVREKSKIRVTSVSPGMVETEFMAASGRPVDLEKVYKVNPCLQAKDVSDCILFVLAAPPHVQIHEMTIHEMTVYPVGAK